MKSIIKKYMHDMNFSANTINLNYFLKITVGPAYYTSMTDSRREGTWVWESSMTVLTAGDYTNWFPGRPSYVANNAEDCMLYGGGYLQFWGDVPCTNGYRAICEAQP